MTKISKNIKRLRNTQNISQEALAEKLFISRQAVSSWENDRTQPDIEMIGKLAEVFNVSIEELIYGEKRKLELENEEPKQNNKLLNLGVETKSSEGDKVSFMEEGKIYMNQQLEILRQMLPQNFGIVVHHIKTWRDLPDIV
jgi:transcriptional regulator with XRE-family HTH domain